MSDDVFDPSKFAKPTVLSAQAAHTEENAFNPGALRDKLKAEKQAEKDVLSAPLGPVPTWSFSRLMNYENCPYSVYLKSVEKAPDPSGPAAERGTQIHEHIENYIQCEHEDVIKEMKTFLPLIDRLRAGWEADKVEIEGDWGFTRDWQQTGFFAKDVWARVKLDAIEFEDETSAVAIDWKTGRKFGNELKHNQQGMTYAIASFMRYPKLQFIKTQFVYLDQNDVLENHYTRDRAMLLKPMLDVRTNTMTTATKFPAKPSMAACRWCAHGKIQEGEDAPRCAYAFEQD